MGLWGLADSYSVFKRPSSAVVSSIEPDSSYSSPESSPCSALGSHHVSYCHSFTGAFPRCPVFIGVRSHLPQDWALPGPQPGLLQLWAHRVIGTKEERTKEHTGRVAPVSVHWRMAGQPDYKGLRRGTVRRKRGFSIKQGL